MREIDRYEASLHTIFSLEPTHSACSIWSAISMYYRKTVEDLEIMVMLNYSPDVGIEIVYGNKIVNSKNIDAVIEVLYEMYEDNKSIDEAIDYVSRIYNIDLSGFKEYMKKARLIVNFYDGYERCWAIYGEKDE